MLPKPAVSAATRRSSRVVAHRLDVVAIGIAHEAAVVVGVVLGADTRRLDHRRAEAGGSREELVDCGAALGMKRDMHLAVRLA